MPTIAPADALYVGLMSGTSADGIDAVVCSFSDGAELVAARMHPWPQALQTRILALTMANAEAGVDEVGELDTAIGTCFADAVQALLEASRVDRGRIAAIGSHGQTLSHRPSGTYPFTLQLGNPWVIAERCGIDVVADFRRADVAAGGQGAPLMPAFHAALLARPGQDHAVLNVGGIANLTILAGDGRIGGFDTGPGNGLMDAWCQRHHAQAFDRDGRWAAQGHADTRLLAKLLSDPYFAAPPPKSTGRDYFDLAWLEHQADIGSLAPVDVQATLLALSVISIRDAVLAHASGIKELVVCGGGAHNRALMQGLAGALAPRRVGDTAIYGADPDYVEAMGFAWLARQYLLGQPGNVPAVTGARGPRVLGTRFPAPPASAAEAGKS